MIEILIMAYALAYVAMEFIWLDVEDRTFLENVIDKTNWSGDKDTYVLIFCLLLLPVLPLAICAAMLYHYISNTVRGE